MKIISEPTPEGIPIDQLSEGQLGVIVEWNTSPHYKGRVVQRFGSHLISVGMASGYGWPDFFRDKHLFEKLRVRVLPKGTVIEID